LQTRLGAPTIKALVILILACLIISQAPPAHAWNPSTSDLSGTNSSTNNNVGDANRRFDIYTDTSINGLQAGEDTDSAAFLIKLAPRIRVGNRWYGFTVRGMQRGDQYELRFTIGNYTFAILFRASGSSAGTCRLYYRAINSQQWSAGEYFTRTRISSGTVYNSPSGNIGFVLTSATSTSPGSVKFIMKKDYLYSLGARGSLVSDIYALATANGNGQPYTGTPNDRCPSTGGVSWTLQGDIPDLPTGILILALPLIAIYIYLSRHPKISLKPVFS